MIRAAIITVLFGLLISELAVAAERESLVRYVGRDAGLCIEVHRAADRRRQFAKSELVRRLHESPMFQLLRTSPPFRHLQKVQRDLTKLSGRPFGELFDGVFGQSVVLAVYPRAGGEPAGVFLTQADSEKTLRDAVNLWNKAEPKNDTKRREHGGITYYKRVVPDTDGREKKPLYYLVLNDVFVLSDNEAMIHNVIRLKQRSEESRSGNTTDTLLALPQYKDALKSVRGKPLLTAYVNPRQWDSVLGAAKPTAENLVPLTAWRSSRWIMATLRIDDGAVVDLVVQLDLKALPERIQRAVERTAAKPEFLDRVPATAIFTLAGRLDVHGIREIIASLSEENQPKPVRRFRKGGLVLLGVDPMKEILPHLRDNYGFYIVGRAKNDAEPGRVPFDGLAAIGVEPAANGQNWREKLNSGLSNALQFVVTMHNLQAAEKGKPLAKRRTTSKDDVSIHWIDSIAGYQPAVALAKRYLAAASSPGLIEDFVNGTKDTRLVADPAFQRWRDRYFPDGHQIAYVNAKRLRQHLREHAPTIVKLWVREKKLKPEVAQRKLQVGLETLGLLDAAFLSATSKSGQIRITVGCVAAKSSKTSEGR